LSQTTESSIFSFEDSVDLGVFEPLWQSFTDSESIGSGEEFPMEDSTDKSVNEESYLGVDVNERLPPVNDEPLYTGSQLTKAQSFLLILSYALRHSLTGVALSDLLDLINIHCPENVLTSKHLFLKELKPIQGHLECHIYCPNCEYYIGDQVTEGQCSVCNSTWDRNSSQKNGNFLPIQTQLEHLLQREDIIRQQTEHIVESICTLVKENKYFIETYYAKLEEYKKNKTDEKALELEHLLLDIVTFDDSVLSLVISNLILFYRERFRVSFFKGLSAGLGDTD
jgi:hypothetical protein